MTEHEAALSARIALMSDVIDILLAVAVEEFHGDASELWNRLAAQGRDVLNEWAEVRVREKGLAP